MRQLIQISVIIVFAVIIVVAIALYPKVSNMKSEYGTAQAIRDLETYVRENHGQWPGSPEKLKGRYPFGGEVVIDFSMTSRELIANPDKLRSAVRPRSGKFHTYPHYDREIEDLLLTLRETNHGAGQPVAAPESMREGGGSSKLRFDPRILTPGPQ